MLCCWAWHSHCLKNSQRYAVAVIVVCTFSSMCTFVYLQTARASPLRPVADVTAAETHQAADVEVMEMHQWEWEHRSGK